MLNNPENVYEDSYEKRERLKRELDLAINDARQFFSVPQKDVDSVRELLESIKEKNGKIEKLNEEVLVLEGELKLKNEELNKINPDEKDIDKRISAGALLMDDIGSLHGKIFEVESMMDILKGEVDAMLEEEKGLLGDSDSSIVALNMKIDRINELERQIKEIDDSQEF